MANRPAQAFLVKLSQQGSGTETYTEGDEVIKIISTEGELSTDYEDGREKVRRRV